MAENPANRPVSRELLSRFSDFVAARFGLHFPEKRWRDLERGIASAAGEFRFDDREMCIKWLLGARLTKSQLDTLARVLTIGETYFFRERKSFDALEARILPALISARRRECRRLRIWSAGCSTGEEAYSIAMLLHKMIPDLSDWNITILATDLNPFSLRKAERGEYGEWSFRGIPGRIKETYFTGNGAGRFVIAPQIGKMVTFARLNLAEDPYPSLFNNTNAMDVIFCRNVMMYFTPGQVKKVVEGFRNSLVPGGWLLVSPCETSHALFRKFDSVVLDDAVFYRRRDRRNPLAATAVAEAPDPAVKLTFVQIPTDLNLRFRHSDPDEGLAAARREAECRVNPGDTSRDGAFAPIGRGSRDDAAGFADLPGNFQSSDRTAALLARSLADKGDFSAALEHCDRAVAADRLDPEIRYIQAVIFQEMGDCREAIAALRKALYLDQDFILAHFMLANLLLGQGKRKEAGRHLDNARLLLESCGVDCILPGSEGMSARRLGEIIAEMSAKAVA